MNETRLIVNADDFGMSHGTTDGILLAHRYGFLTSASLMVNMPASEYAVSQAAHAPNLGIGIHLNLCHGRPILPASEIPSLVDADGSFHAPSILIRRLWRWQVSVREMECEFRAQIRWMIARGLHPTHADSHHHMHIYPAAVMPFLRALHAEGIRCARASRCARYPNDNFVGGPHEGSLARRILVQSYRSALQSALFYNLVSPDYRVSFLSRDRRSLTRLGLCWKSAFANLPAGTFELACHPGFFEKGFSESDPIHLQREEELQWLTDREFRRVLDCSGVRLITYNQLIGERAEARVTQQATAL
jgi:chitin disaccharide deacetylase